MSSNDISNLLTRCRTVGTCALSDALDQCGIAGVIDGLAPRSGAGSVAARAVTACESILPYSAANIPSFDIGRLIGMLSPETILVIEIIPIEIVSTIGDSRRMLRVGEAPSAS